MHKTILKQLLAALLMTPVAVFAAPGDILFSDNFNDAALAPWTTTDASLSGILTGGPTSNSIFPARRRLP